MACCMLTATGVTEVERKVGSTSLPGSSCGFDDWRTRATVYSIGGKVDSASSLPT